MERALAIEDERIAREAKEAQVLKEAEELK